MDHLVAGLRGLATGYAKAPATPELTDESADAIAALLDESAEALESLHAEAERLRAELREHCDLAKSSNAEHADVEAAWRAEAERLREERRWRTFPANLPDANGRYVCMWADGDMYIQRWNGSKWLGAFDHEITHWMPLPEPPMEE